MAAANAESKQPWTAQGEEKRALVQGMFAEIAPTYDRCNSLASLGLHHRWRAYAARCLNCNKGDTVLDLCCGTGDFLKPLRAVVGEEGRLIGMDFCAPMLQISSSKDGTAQLGLADACNLPVQDSKLDGLTIGWGIRNVPNIDQAHRETFRVLKPGKRFVSLDMARPRFAPVRFVARLITNNLLPLLGSMFGKREAYTYLPQSTDRFLDRVALKESMERAGFVNVNYHDLFMGNICVHWGTKP
ncbi:MAG: ubiquinone/menaquinone biosynthesis methyltransferase [Fimbriimonadaceae bacterium]